MVRLDFFITGDPWEDHFRPTAKSGEIVVSNRADCDQQIRFNCSSVQSKRQPGTEISDFNQIRPVAAVVFDHPDTGRDGADQLGHLLRPRERMGAVRDEDRQRALGETSSFETLENNGQNLRQADLPRGIRNDHCRRADVPCPVDDRRTIQWLVEGVPDDIARIQRRRRRRWRDTPHPQTSQVEGEAVSSVRQFDNHLRTIAF